MKWLASKLFKLLVIFLILFLMISFGKKFYMEIKYPLLYIGNIKEHSEEFDIDPYLVASVINVESSYDKMAISNKEAKGLMQISKSTGEWASQELGIEDFDLDLLFEADTNIRIGTWYLNRLNKEFNGNIQLVLAAYNGGSGNVTKWLGDEAYSDDGVYLKKIPFKETEDYIVRVLENYDIYRNIYEGEFNRSKEDEEDGAFLITTVNNLKKAFKNLTISK